ncbi:MAG: LysM domain-containing protein [Desulfosporosinus sp.]|nr:LysM domain-containing protein [Desulfosporosinus sp.]
MYYIIRRGDSLHSIAMHYGTTVSNLMALNPQISNPHRIHVGERILVSKRNKWGSNESKSQHRGR